MGKKTFVDRRLIALGLVSLSFAFSTHIATAQPAAINVGIISADSPGEGKVAWDPVLQEFSRMLNLPVRGFYTSTYSGVLQAAIDGRVHIARMSPRLALDAITSGKLEVFAQQAWSDGTIGYKSQIIVREDLPIRSLDEIAKAPGKYRYGHSERQSTSGYVVPEQLFAQHKISAPLHFTRMQEGTHQSNMLDVANGELDIAAVNSSRMEKFRKKFPDEAKRLRVIWESPPIPDVMWVIRKDLDEPTRLAIKKTVIGYGKGARSKEQLIHLKKIYDLKGFVPASNATLWPMLEWSRLADRGTVERAQYANAQERTKRLTEVDRMYADIAVALGLR